MTFFARIFVNLCKIMAKIEKFFFFASIWLPFSKKTNSKFEKNVLLRGRATFPLWFEPKHNYVGPAVTEWIYEPVGLIRADFLAVGLFLGRKSKISHEQNVKEFQFYIRIPNFRPLGSIIKKKYRKVADPLNAFEKEIQVASYMLII